MTSSSTEDLGSTSLLQMTTDIVASFVEGNQVAAVELGGLIKSVHGALSSVGTAGEAASAAPNQKATPAQIRKSISEKGLVSFEDGKTYQTLKRHLTIRGLTVAQYKEKWGLPSNYPATSPSYAAKRSELAKAIGLGRKPAAAATPRAPAPRKKKAKKG